MNFFLNWKEIVGVNNEKARVWITIYATYECSSELQYQHIRRQLIPTLTEEIKYFKTVMKCCVLNKTLK